MDDESVPVELYIYDITGGLAAGLSQMLIGQHIEGIWHTSIVVYGREYFYGGAGIQNCTPGGAIGPPQKIERLGETYIPFSVFIDYLLGLGDTTFAGASYNLLTHNCNNFSHEIAQFLCGKAIPAYILDLPESLLATPIGQQLRPFLESLASNPNASPVTRAPERPPSPDFQRLNQQVEEARKKSYQLKENRNSIKEKLARREKKKEKKRRKQLQESGIVLDSNYENGSYCCEDTMADSEITMPVENGNTNGAEEVTESALPSEIALELESQERREDEERKKARDPPVLFKDTVNIQTEFDALVGLIDGHLNEDEQRSLEELHQYMLEDEGSWALGEGFLDFIGRLLHDKSLATEVRVRTLHVLALAALKDDCILIMHQDRREHILMNYAFEIDRLPPEEQEALALFICNLFENLSSSEWLLYISEWTYCNQSISNIRCTTKVAVHSLLSDRPLLQERGVAIIHNLACKEVFDDVAVELTMALLQFFQSKPDEEQLFRCMKALARFTQISGQEVPQLIQMIGPDPKTFKGISERIDEQITQISRKIR